MPALRKVFDPNKEKPRQDIQEERLMAGKKNFSPLFDNGSSLGRELEETRVTVLLQDSAAIQRYLHRGETAIFWEGQKVSHFQLIESLLATAHRAKVEETIAKAHSLFNPQSIAHAINKVDEHLPLTHTAYRLPDARKALIANMITLRFEKLQTLCHARI